MSMTTKQADSYPCHARPITFPLKLHKLLCEASENGHDDVISWLPDGKSFKVHDRTKFANEVMSKYFGSSKFRSFQKNLNMWKFKNHDDARQRNKDVSNVVKNRGSSTNIIKGTCSHPFFVRDEPSLCRRMIRLPIYKRRGGHAAHASDSDDSTVASAGSNAAPPAARSTQDNQGKTLVFPRPGRSINHSRVASAIRNSIDLLQRRENRSVSGVEMHQRTPSSRQEGTLLLGTVQQSLLPWRSPFGVDDTALPRCLSPSPLLPSSLIDGHTKRFQLASDEVLLSSLLVREQQRLEQQRSFAMSLKCQRELSNRLEQEVIRRRQLMATLADLDRRRAKVAMMGTISNSEILATAFVS